MSPSSSLLVLVMEIKKTVFNASTCLIHQTMHRYFTTAGDGGVSWTLGAALAEGQRLALLQPAAPVLPWHWHWRVHWPWQTWCLAVAALAGAVWLVQWALALGCRAGRRGLMKQSRQGSPGGVRAGGVRPPRRGVLGGVSLFGKTKS